MPAYDRKIVVHLNTIRRPPESRRFANRTAIKREILSAFPDLHPSWMTPEEVRRLDRISRDELAIEGISVTSPVGEFGYEREPSAPAVKRLTSRQSRYGDLITRATTLARFARSDASQTDASDEERSNATVLALVADMLRRVTRRD